VVPKLCFLPAPFTVHSLSRRLACLHFLPSNNCSQHPNIKSWIPPFLKLFHSASLSSSELLLEIGGPWPENTPVHYLVGIMSENKVPAPTTRPRLLSDILEIPLSESAIPEEYTMQRPSLSSAPPPNGNSEGHKGLPTSHSSSHSQPKTLNPPTVLSPRDPGVIGQLPRRGSSSSLFTQTDRLQPLTPINPQFSHRYNEHRRSTPNPLTAFSTSPAVSEQGSPSQSQFATLDRSFGQTPLTSRRNPSRPRTPTPSAGGFKGKARSGTRSSSLPGSPKSRRATPHPHGKPSVKHLTCFWWKVKGDCRFSEEDCLYAHHDTGLLADAPRQVTPGGEQTFTDVYTVYPY
jgi:hypothetical protein